MKVVIRTVIVQHYCYYRCTTTAVLLPLYYYRCTTTAVLLPLYYYRCTSMDKTWSKTSLKSAFSVHSTEPEEIKNTKEMEGKKKKWKKKKWKKIRRKDVNTLKIKLHQHTWVCAQHIHRHIHTDMPLKQTLGS